MTRLGAASGGDVLGGRYVLVERIAGGGMGDVWEATDSVLGRTVAIKVMRPNVDDEPVFADRFRDEARHTAGLQHPNIAATYDYGEEDGRAYLVMELVHGVPLSEIIAAGALTEQRSRTIAGQAALALAAAHEAGVVHRDVKPANIIVVAGDGVKLTDFGIARAADSSGHTRVGEVIGTPYYLSPEQAVGEVATPLSDIYALGIVTFEMLTGSRPFDAGSPVATAMAQVRDAPPPLPRAIGAETRDVVLACLQKDPARRPASAAILATALGMAVGGVPRPDRTAADTLRDIRTRLTSDTPSAPLTRAAMKGRAPSSAPPTGSFPIVHPELVPVTRRAAREGAATRTTSRTTPRTATRTATEEPTQTTHWISFRIPTEGGTGMAVRIGAVALVVFVALLIYAMVLRR